MIVFTELIYYNPSIGKIYDIIKNVKGEQNDRYGFFEKYKLSVKVNIEFIDQLNNKTKKVTIIGYLVLGRAKEREMASKNGYKNNEVNKLNIVREGKISKHIVNTYLKMQIPLLWREFFINFANNEEYNNTYCNNPYNNFREYCHELYLHNLVKNNDVTLA